jgi:ribosomal protein L37AE/L43A
VNKISEIFQAWVAAANPTPEQTLIAESRSAICDTCDKKEYVKALAIFICGECGCPLSKKVFSPAEGPKACPLAKWEK